MNERIDILALQATDSKGGLSRHKFAELIIQECLNIIDEEKCGVKVSNNLAPLETLWSVECAIKENFGVTE